MPSNEKIIRIILRLQDEASAKLEKSATSVQKLGSSLTSLGTQMTAAFTVPIAAAGAAAVKMSMDLDKSMRNIQSITKESDDSISELSDAFRYLSTDMSKTTDSALNLSEAYYQIISSGIDAADAWDVLLVATKAASAGLTETSVAAEAIVSTLNAYGMSVDQAAIVSDILFETVNRGVGSFEELASSMSNVTGLANTLGVPLEEVAAAMATMSKQGMSFAEASVAMNQAMSNLISPTAEGQKIIEAMGYASGEAMVEALGFAGALQAISKHTGGSATEMSKLFSNVRGLRAALALTGDGAEMFAEDLAAMGASAGATQAAFAEQMKSFDAHWKNFQNTFGVMLMDFGNTLIPILISIMDALQPIMQGLRELPEPLKLVIIGFLAFVAILGPLVLIVGQLIAAFTAISGAIAAFSAIAFAPIIVIGLLIAAFALLLAAVIFNWGGIRDYMFGVIQMIVAGIQNLVWAIINGATSLVGQLSGLVGSVGVLIIGAWQRMIAIAQQSAGQLMAIIGAAFQKLPGMAANAVMGLLEHLKNLATGFYDMGQAIITGLINGIKSKAVDLVAYIFGLSKELTAAIKKALGISSPSKVMMKLGQQTAEGFHIGMKNAGGLEIGTPSVGGNAVGSTSSMRPAFAGATGGGGGYGNITINVYSNKDPREVAREVNRELATMFKKKGGKG